MHNTIRATLCATILGSLAGVTGVQVAKRLDNTHALDGSVHYEIAIADDHIGISVCLDRTWSDSSLGDTIENHYAHIQNCTLDTAASAPNSRRWELRPAAEWLGPRSGVRDASGLLVIPMRSLCLPPDSMSSSSATISLIDIRSTEKGCGTLLHPFGSVLSSEYITIDTTSKQRRLAGGVLVVGDLSLHGHVGTAKRAIRLWGQRGLEPIDGPRWQRIAEVAWKALNVLPPATDPMVSEMVIATDSLAKLADPMNAWLGVSVTNERQLERQVAMAALSQLLEHLPEQVSDWLYYGFLDYGAGYVLDKANVCPLETWRREKEDLYAARDSWRFSVIDGPREDDFVLWTTWRLAGAPLAVAQLVEKAGVSGEEALQSIARILLAGQAREADRIAQEFGDHVAAFYESLHEDTPMLCREVAGAEEEAIPADSTNRGTWITFACTANQDGFLETCGCAVNQDGGMARRNTAFGSIRASSPWAMTIDLGNCLPPEHLTSTTRDELAVILGGLRLADYTAIVPSLSDLRLLEWVAVKTGNAATDPKWTLCNVLSRSIHVSPTGTILELQDGLKIALCGVASMNWETRVPEAWDAVRRGPTVDLLEPVGQVTRWVAGLPQDTDITAVCGQVAPILVEELVRKAPSLSLIISSRSRIRRPSATGGATIELNAHSGMIGNTLVVYCNPGPYAIEVLNLLWHNGKLSAMRRKRVPLGETIAEDEETRTMLNAFYDKTSPPEAWSLGPLFQEAKDDREYVGSTMCADCHQDIFRQWLPSAHGQAFNTLLKVRRHHVPKCVRCHVVGFGVETGYARDNQDVLLQGIGCEQCHGKGSAHGVSGSPTDIRRGMPPSDGCGKCHDREHSPSFDGNKAEYWEGIKHW